MGADVIVSGLAVGLLFGMVLQRGRFCMYTAFRDVLLTHDTTLLKAYALAVVVQMAGVQALAQGGLLQPSTPPFFWLAAMLGGFLFGAGMALGGGCASGTWYRVGEGMVGSWAAVLAFLVVAGTTARGALAPLTAAVRGVRADLGGAATLPTVLGVHPWVLIGLVAAGVVVLVTARPGRRAVRGWSWQRTGLILGAVALLAWGVAASLGRHWGLSVVGPSISLMTYLTTGDTALVDWGLFMIVGLPVGSALAAWRAGEWAWRAPAASRLVVQIGGGGLMGFGAALAGGCNIGHALTGVGLFALTSILATLFIVAGAWTATYLLFVRT